MKPREQGDWGELQALTWLAGRGYPVAIPVFHSPDWDLITEIEGRILRVQVKTTRRRTAAGRWGLMICTRGGNQSWNGTVKRLDSSRCDYLFAAVADGRRWFVPSSAFGGGSGMLLGGPKYADFEVDAGPPMPGWDDRLTAV